MRKVILADKTIIEDCTDSTTSNEIYALRTSYEEAGAVRDLFTSENASIIEVQDEDGNTTTKGSDLVLLDGASLTETEEGVICKITTRVKTTTEKMQDEIAELQEVIIGG